MIQQAEHMSICSYEPEQLDSTQVDKNGRLVQILPDSKYTQAKKQEELTDRGR